MKRAFEARETCVVVPAYQAARSVGPVVTGLRAELEGVGAIVVVDDGSTDATAEAAAGAGARVVVHDTNRGKGAALVTGLLLARDLGFASVLTVDADGQHPAASARAVLFGSPDPAALVLGVRDLARAGAPRANQRSNGISNYFLSRFCGRPLADTQCGLRRYPVRATLALGARARGYAFEAEVIVRACAAGVPLAEVPIDVHYPPESERVSHFHVARDPARIIAAVLVALWDTRGMHRRQGRAVQG